MRASSTQKSFRRVLTEQEHGLSGVPVFACAKGKEAVLPMIEHRHKDKYECVLLGEGTRILTAGGLPYTVYPENAFLHILMNRMQRILHPGMRVRCSGFS